MENALVVIEQARKNSGAIVYAQKSLDCPPLYKPEATEIYFAKKCFHSIQGKLVPRKESCDDISRAAGITYILSENVTEYRNAEPALDLPARSVFVSKIQGRVRSSDGSWQESTIEVYAFDYVAKAMAEACGDKGKEKRLLQEYYKAGPMRASTGARLRVIRQLTAMPTAFEPSEIGEGKVFVFSKIVQNTDYILGTKEGRIMAMAAATGAVQQLYGVQQAKPEVDTSQPVETVTDDDPPMRHAEDTETTPASLADEAMGDGFGDEPENNPRKEAVLALEGYLSSDTLNEKAATTVKGLIDNPATTLEQMKSYLEMLRAGKGLKQRFAS